MSDVTNAPATLAALRARHEALASTLAPITEQLRSLVEERTKLAEDTKAAQEAAQVAWTRPGWVVTGEDDFWTRSGRDESAAALTELLVAVDKLDDAGEEEVEAGEEPAAQPAGWVPRIPAYATESDAGMDRFNAELGVAALVEEHGKFREAIVSATHAARNCFAGVGKTFPGSAEDVEAEGQTVEGLLARALLTLTIHVDEATETRRRDVARLAEEG